MSREGEIPATPLSDRECLLVQFVHERKKPVQVAFQAWVKDRSLDLKKAVESEIVIRWPCEVDVVCAKLMERKLRNCVNWQDLVVKVRAVGEWTDMCRQASSIKKFGVPNPTKKERRQLCAKMISSSEGEMSTTEEEVEDIAIFCLCIIVKSSSDCFFMLFFLVIIEICSPLFIH
ncbi:uncharacterized protein LOC124160467 [Ischnura elegans]|uniref:uncharacterized protein LOC124160467 n=1 Tax=Ischnura elegans TaxID=197161 RepID=UPI001ED8A7D1|nr:uncharacterized protein LOC124160467 [Ischnura elegans]